MTIPAWKSLFNNTYLDKPCVVTGGAGFIGSHISEALLELGAKVTVLDNLCAGSLDNLAHLKSYGDKLRFVKGSVTDRDALKDALSPNGVIFHQAALGSVPRSMKEPELYFEQNIIGTHRLLESALAIGARRVVFAASSSAYGNSITLPKHENMPCLPMSPYAVSKVADEGILRTFALNTALDTASLRYFNIFGPRQNSNSAYAAVIAAFAKALSQDQQPVIYGDGLQSRDFTYVRNAVYANLLAGASEKPIKGEVVNIACGQAITVNDLATQMAKFYNKPHLTPIYKEDRAGDVKHSLAALEKAKTIIGYSPLVNFSQGLELTCKWYQTNPF